MRGDGRFQEEPKGEKIDQACSFDCIVWVVPDLLIFTLPYLYAAYVYAAEGSMSEWLDGDGEEDTTEGLFVVLRILFVLRVGVCMGLDA